MEGAMPRINLIGGTGACRGSRSTSAREARLRLEEIERLVVSKQRQARLRRIFYVLRIRISRGAPQQNRMRELLSDRRPGFASYFRLVPNNPRSTTCGPKS